MDNPKPANRLPTDLTHGVGTFINKEEGFTTNLKILIILIIFSLLLIIIGTVIIVQSYQTISTPIQTSSSD